nr:PREDICTED: zinc finger protein 77-like [Bemisia tabaci]
MDPDNVPEVTYAGTLKHESSELDTKSAFGDDHADLVPQRVKRENGSYSCGGVLSPGPLQGDSLFGLSARVKVEVDESLSDLLHTSIEIKEEDTSQSDQSECPEKDTVKDSGNDSRRTCNHVPVIPPSRSGCINGQPPHQPQDIPGIKLESNGGACNSKTLYEPHIERAVFPTNRTKIRYKPVKITQRSVSPSCEKLPKQHMRTHNGKKPQNLKEHIRTHTGEKPFSCGHCSTSFRQKRALKEHIRTHTGEKPFSCSHCPSSFSRKRALEEHIRTHTGEKPFSCSHCPSSFRQGSALKEHIRTHTGENPFSCSHCPSSFSRKRALEEHIRTHTGEKPFSCSHCPSSFRRKRALKDHIRTHTGEKPFSCSHCSSSFRHRNALKEHIRTHTEML